MTTEPTADGETAVVPETLSQPAVKDEVKLPEPIAEQAIVIQEPSVSGMQEEPATGVPLPEGGVPAEDDPYKNVHIVSERFMPLSDGSDSTTTYSGIPVGTDIETLDPQYQILTDGDVCKHSSKSGNLSRGVFPLGGTQIVTSGKLTGSSSSTYTPAALHSPTKPSEFIGRDGLSTSLSSSSKTDDSPDAPKRKKRPTFRTALCPTIFRVDQYSLFSLYARLKGNWAFNFLSDKLWESICPQGIDLTFYGGRRPLTPRKWLVDAVINGVWADQVRLALRNMLAVGYAVVVYGPCPDLDGEIVPTVLEPDEVTLEWEVDQNGMRYYTPRPLGHLLAVNKPDKTGRPAFQAADVFFSMQPTHFGRPRSKAMAALDQLILIDQLFMDYRAAAHSRVNMPTVVQTRDIAARHNATGDPRVPGYNTNGAGPQPFGADGVSAASGEYGMGLRGFYNSVMTLSNARTKQEMVRRTMADASLSARLTSFEVGDSETGEIAEFTPEQMWQRTLVSLPPNSEIAKIEPPELPTEFGSTLRLAVSMACSIFGVPAEVVLGAAAGGAKVATATLAQEQLRAAVTTWRKTLVALVTKAYWRIYGDDHMQHLAEACVANKMVLTEEEAIESVEDMAIEFSFRQNRLDQETAQSLFSQGLLSGEAYAKFAMKEYGLSHKDVIIPLSQAEMARLEYARMVLGEQEQAAFDESQAARKRPASDETSSSGSDGNNGADDPKQPSSKRSRSVPPSGNPSASARGAKRPTLGDIGMNDVNSIAFSGHTRAPTRNQQPRV